jgi:hypothetical protein
LVVAADGTGASEAVAGPGDPAELLDVDVDELAGAAALVAVGRLRRLQPREPPQPRSPEERADRRERHLQRLRDLGRGQTQSSQHEHEASPSLRRPVRDPLWRRGTIREPGLALGPPACEPLGGGARTHAGCRGRLGVRPALRFDPLDEQPAAARAGPGVTVNNLPRNYN